MKEETDDIDITKVDYYALPRQSVERLLFNKIVEQSLIESPSAQVLALAAKMLSVGAGSTDDKKNSLEALSTDELIVKIKGLM